MLAIFRHRIIQTVIKQLESSISKQRYSNIIHLNRPVTVKVLQHNLQTIRCKSKKAKGAKAQTESETEESGEEDINDKTTKTMQVSMKSLRIDGVIKSGLGIARNKVETLFYESKIRVNGEKVLKKSSLVAEGDEIDIHKGVSPTNPDFLLVARVEVLSIEQKGEAFLVKIRRSKSLAIEKYQSV